MQDRWLSREERYAIADEYQSKFVDLCTSVQLIQEHPFISSYRFLSGRDISRFSRLPSYEEAQPYLLPYSGTADMHFLSHRWFHPKEPDPDGRQMALLKTHIKASDKYWIDYSCLPHGGRTVAEEALFREAIEMLPSLLFDMPVLVLRLADDGYLSRYWCYFEMLAGTVIGKSVTYVGDASLDDRSAGTLVSANLERTLLSGELPPRLEITDSRDLEQLKRATVAIRTFFLLSIITHYMVLGQNLTNQKFFFAEDPYYLLAACDFSKIVSWTFHKARELGMDISELTTSNSDKSFFETMAEKEQFVFHVDPWQLPKKLVIDESRIGWFIANRHNPASSFNLFCLVSTLIE